MDIRQLTASLECISDGIALFDADERLVLSNAKFREIFDGTAELMVPGVRFEELLRQSIALGENLDALGKDPEEYVQARLLRFRYPGQPFEFRLSDGRWVLVRDQKAADGSTVCIRTDITELKRREAALRESEQRYRQLVDLSPDGIAVHDTQGRGRFLNSAGRRILGLAEDTDPAGLSVLSFATPESRPLAEAMMRRVAGGESVTQVRIPLRRQDGADWVAEFSAVPFFSGTDRLVLCLFRDVSDEAAASLKLRQSEARARSILESALDCIISVDSDGLVQEFNPAAERTFGWSRAEAMGRNMGELIIPTHLRAAHDRGMARLKETGEHRLLGRRMELEAMRRDGTVFPVELAITEVALGPGRRYTAYIRDITGQRQAKAEIDEKTRILEAMMESVGVGIEVYDAHGRLLVANRRLTELLDLPEDFLCPGTWDRDVLKYLAEHGEYPGETVEQSLADYDRIRERGHFFGERQRPNGKWLQVRHFPMPGGGYVALFADVTEQKTLQAQLLQSQKMEALGQLAGGLAHDFNNILSVIGGYAGMAREEARGLGAQGSGAESLSAYLAKIRQGVDRAAALTRELLTFSRQRVGEARTVDLGAVVRGQEFLLKPLLGASIALSVAVPREPVWVAVDPDMAAQALVNLAINARDAMPEGGPLAVALHVVPSGPAELPPGPCAMLVVEDRGCGMTEAVRARIFDPFFTTKPPARAPAWAWPWSMAC
ncbi:PAS domain S-box protein [Aerophototrophica crusticola]|uniref:histidine kinase n=1 Tax=Aerophototrophica crusticola TaxID=1709002 RepID=A0A858RAK8_9PROT|nr:PAS domain S-box protein [Rhodospirillaceae bacterium B3]